MYKITRSTEEIDAVLNEIAESENSGEQRFPGMSYEQGIKAGLEWIMGDVEDHPYPAE